MSAPVSNCARREPQKTTLYAGTAGSTAPRGSASPLPGFVRSELEGCLACGLLRRGVARVACNDPECHARHRVAFSREGRGFCPSYPGRRMVQTAANRIDPVLPEEA